MSQAHEIERQPYVSVWCVIHHTHTHGNAVRERCAPFLLERSNRRAAAIMPVLLVA